MKRTINSTGRRKLTLDQVTIRIEDPAVAGGTRRFSAELTGLDDMNLPANARVYVEPYARSSFMRFDYGTVATLRAPSDTGLVDIDAGSPVLFDVKVVDESENIGRILAAARAISPVNSVEGDDKRRSLLPVESRDLGELVWQLDMPPDARPVLVLNSRVPNALVRLKSDPLIQGAILPAAIALILDRLLDPEGPGTEDDEWVDDWLTWYRAATGIEPEERLDAEERRILVLNACQSFATQQRFATRTEGFGDQQEGSNND
ncbi:hypothetical protein PK98_12960 [Croceibacterium mercuriale]|uniref:Uncharacterized protein n=1 Tax=Croceibacterium mercuriale TaxID=1572751 RepID=A0A0B2BXT1_9SPHN|nr:hypothetical protein [Croceibacterium mercuriale]KHL24802.1 hypothetical protein PK98_12960 [Croceibacterium mercuriale]